MQGPLTANVFITKSRRAIDKLFFGETKLVSFKERMLLLNDEELVDSFISSPYKNDGLIRFEYKFGKSDGTFVKLEFIETEKSLEYVLIGNDPMARMLEAKASQKISDLNILTGDTDGFRKNTIESKLEGLSKSNTYYFAFGAGDDLSKWSGPYTMTLAGATLKNDELGVRSVLATFVPNLNSNKLWSKRFQEEFGYGGTVNKFNELLSRESYVVAEEEEYVDIFNPKEVLDLNTKIRKLTKKFISSTTNNPNVIVAFPNNLKKLGKPKKGRDEISSLYDRMALLGIKLVSSNTYEDTYNGLGSTQEALGDQTAKNQIDNGFYFLMGIRFLSSDSSGDNSPPPLLTPLYKLASGLKSLFPEYAKQEFDFYEETDIKILRLWEKYGFIKDSTKSAFVFGDMDYIANILYLNSFDTTKGKSDFNDFDTAKFLLMHPQDATPVYTGIDNYPKDKTYQKYFDDFATEFDLKDEKNRSSSFNEPTPKNKGNGIEFRHNISNPNILELQYSNDNFYAALVGLDAFPSLKATPIGIVGTYAAVSSIAVDILGSGFIKNTIKLVEDLIPEDSRKDLSDFGFVTLALQDKGVNDSILRQILPAEGELSNSVANLTTFDLVSFIAFIRHLSNLEPPKGVFIISESERYESLYTAMYSRLQTLLVNISLKTVPFFKQKFFIKRKCSLIGNNNSIVGFESNKRKAPYTGDYIIVGWSHVIEYDTAYSTFELVRDSIGADAGSAPITNQKVKDAAIDFLLEEITRLEKREEFIGGGAKWIGRINPYLGRSVSARQLEAIYIDDKIKAIRKQLQLLSK